MQCSLAYCNLQVMRFWVKILFCQERESGTQRETMKRIRKAKGKRNKLYGSGSLLWVRDLHAIQMRKILVAHLRYQRDCITLDYSTICICVLSLLLFFFHAYGNYNMDSLYQSFKFGPMCIFHFLGKPLMYHVSWVTKGINFQPKQNVVNFYGQRSSVPSSCPDYYPFTHILTSVTSFNFIYVSCQN